MGIVGLRWIIDCSLAAWMFYSNGFMASLPGAGFAAVVDEAAGWVAGVGFAAFVVEAVGWVARAGLMVD